MPVGVPANAAATAAEGPGEPSSARGPAAVTAVSAGQRYVDPVLAADALTEPPSPLTPREAAVLSAAGADRPAPEVARALLLSAGTVRNHLAAITQKLGAGSRAEAHRIARDHGWI